VVPLIKEEIIAYGHHNITSKHKTTLEITKTDYLNKEGDCIIAVKSNKACSDLSKKMKNALKCNKKIGIIIEVGGVRDKIIAYGSHNLKLTHKEDIVIRKSDFIDERTLAIHANKAACDLREGIIEKLHDPNVKVKVLLKVK